MGESGRNTGKDITALQLDTDTDILATWRDGSLRIGRPPVDVSAVADEFDVTEDGRMNWSVRCGKVIASASVFPAKIIAGGTCSFSYTECATGVTYSGKVRFTSVDIAFGDAASPQLENCELTGVGALTPA